MIRRVVSLLLALVAVMALSSRSVDAFTTTLATSTNTATKTQLNLFGFGEKDDGSPGDYVCLVRFTTWWSGFGWEGNESFLSSLNL